jgi:ligand-binding sensor domain-containing protein
VDPSDLVWAATNDGLASFNGASWNVYTASSGLYSNSTYCVTAPTDQCVWVGTSVGLNWRPSTGWTGDYLLNKPLPSNTVRRICYDDSGRLWFATQGGLSRKDGEYWDIWSEANSAMSGYDCLSVYVDGDQVAWIGMAAQGLNKFDGSGWTTYTTADGLAGNTVMDIDQEPGSDLWIATILNGVSRFDRISTFTNYTTADNLGSNICSSVAVDGTGNVWAGTAGGVSRFDGTSNWTNYTTANGLPANWVNDVACRGTEVWVATASGGVAYTADNGSSWTTFDTTDGLPSNDVRAIAATAGGDIYAATAAGLAVRVGTTWTARNSWYDGLLRDVVNSVTVTPDGKTVYMGTAAGVSIYRPEHVND